MSGPSAQPAGANPLLQAWHTPQGLPPFERIRAEHIEPALEAAFAEHRAEVAALLANPAPPDVNNTVAALDRAGRQLGRVHSVLMVLAASVTTPELQAVQRRTAPRLAAHTSAVWGDPALFARLDALLASGQAPTDPATLRLLQRQHRQCQRQGAGLPAAARARHAELMQALASLATLFAQNVLHDESTGGLSLADAAAMAGLPAWLRDAARQAAAERGLEGALIPWSRSLVMAFLSFSERADLRHAVWRGWSERGSHAGEHDNRAVVADILRCRHELARLTGHTSYADFALEDTMALTPQRVQALLDEVMQRALPKARQEAEALQALRDRHEPALAGQPLHEADWRYWAQRHRREVLALDDAELKPYFELRRMEAAAMDCAARLFGLRFVERADWPTYHADARVFEVSQLGGQPVGALLLDPFSRPGKRSGAWMSSLRWQTRGGLPLAEGETAWATPIILNNNNIARAGDGATLLSAEEVRTLFHEFGHALHGLLSDVPWQQQSGTQVLRDWVELPSQLFEHWIEEPEVLKRHARHHSSGEPMPDALIDKLARARHVGQGFDTVRYCISAQADLALHRRTEAEPPADLLRWEADFIAASGAPPGCGSNHRLLHFQHLFAGSAYASGYYVYLWAEVLEADVWQAFVEAGDVFSKPLAERLRQTIYASGDSIEPNSAFASFRGRAPRIEPLLAQRGLLEPA